MDEIDRSLLTDEHVNVSPRLLAHVMAEVRAIAQPIRPRFPWYEFSLRVASYAGFVAAGAAVFVYVDPSVFRPVAAELFGAGAILVTALVAVRLPALRRELSH